MVNYLSPCAQMPRYCFILYSPQHEAGAADIRNVSSQYLRIALFQTCQPPAAVRMSYGGGQKVQKVMVQPINLIFRYLQNRTKVSVWLYENVNTRWKIVFLGFSYKFLKYTRCVIVSVSTTVFN